MSEHDVKADIPGCCIDPRLWVVEWSALQGCIHIDQVDAVLEMNRTMVLFEDRMPSDYVILGIVETREEANHLADLLEPKLRAARAAREDAGVQP